ncbi:hypothetical protein AMECASPLE_008476 [Ameca splendens]|uniref:Uncharacterized protein n=1 Tax=Ameca splendens TaxID=208324 RepID=A0ABV0XNW4_9TELE
MDVRSTSKLKSYRAWERDTTSQVHAVFCQSEVRKTGKSHGTRMGAGVMKQCPWGLCRATKINLTHIPIASCKIGNEKLLKEVTVEECMTAVGYSVVQTTS